MSTAGAVVVGLAGVAIVVLTVLSALQTLAVPRAIPILIMRWVSITVRLVLGLFASRAKDYRGRDCVLALSGPFGLLALPVIWLVLVLVLVGYLCIFWSLGVSAVAYSLRRERVVAAYAGLSGAGGPADDGSGLRRGGDGSGPGGAAGLYLPAIYAS